MDDNNNIESLKAKGRRLNELAQRGIGGEKSNAKRMLDDFLRKHKLTIEQIDTSINDRSFTVDNEDDATILLTTILSVNPYSKPVSGKKFVTANLDNEDYIEVKNKFKYFTKLFRVERELLRMAFFGKHEKFFKPDHSKEKFRDGSKQMNEDLMKAGFDAESIQRQAEQEFKTQVPSLEFSSDEKEQEIQMIQKRNLARLEAMKQLMLDATYVYANRTVEK